MPKKKTEMYFGNDWENVTGNAILQFICYMVICEIPAGFGKMRYKILYRI